MRICLIASSRYPIREPFAGGLESHTASLARELYARGHDLAVFAAPGSELGFPVAELTVRDWLPSRAAQADVASPSAEWMQEHHSYLSLMLRLAREGAEQFDLVLNNSLHHLPVAMSPMVPVPVVTTLHTPPLPWLESAIDVTTGPGTGPVGSFVAVSAAMQQAWSHVVSSVTIRNGVDVSAWPVGPGGDGAVWSGRLTPEKAPHDAIDAASQAGFPITLAGPALDHTYFDEMVRPRLGPAVEYAGHLDHRALRELIGSSAVAVVTPHWDEPFGLVAAEAMCCGTPVACYDRGGLAEIVAEGTGIVAHGGDPEALATAIVQAATCDRAVVREHAESALSLRRMVDEYEALFTMMLGRAIA